MAAVVDELDGTALDPLTPMAHAVRRISLLGQDPEGYAKACDAFDRVVVDGKMDGAGKISVLCNGRVGDGLHSLHGAAPNANLDAESSKRYEGVGGEWCVFRDLDGVKEAVGAFL